MSKIFYEENYYEAGDPADAKPLPHTWQYEVDPPDSPKVSPCRYCGGFATLGGMIGAHYVHCMDCRARGPVADSEQLAADYWNGHQS